MDFSIDFGGYWSSPNLEHAGQVHLSALAFCVACFVAMLMTRRRSVFISRWAVMGAIFSGIFSVTCVVAADVAMDSATTIFLFSADEYARYAPGLYDDVRLTALIVGLVGVCVVLCAMWFARRGPGVAPKSRRWPWLALVALLLMSSGLLLGAWRVALEQGEIQAIEVMGIVEPERKAALYATFKAESDQRSLVWFYAGSALASLAFGVLVSRRQQAARVSEASPQAVPATT